MGFSNIDCINISKIGCEYYIDGFLCPENCEGFINNKEQKIVEEITDKRSKK
jgi:hypothetical protein